MFLQGLGDHPLRGPEDALPHLVQEEHVDAVAGVHLLLHQAVVVVVVVEGAEADVVLGQEEAGEVDHLLHLTTMRYHTCLMT